MTINIVRHDKSVSSTVKIIRTRTTYCGAVIDELGRKEESRKHHPYTANERAPSRQVDTVGPEPPRSMIRPLPVP